MVSNITGTLIFLALFGIVSTNPDGGVDCRKFVFAPLCRGVAAKRDANPGHYESPTYINEESIKQLLGSLHDAIHKLENDDEEESIRTSDSKHSKLRNLLRMFQQEQNNRLLKLLFGNRRSTSDKDNLSEEDFANF